MRVQDYAPPKLTLGVVGIVAIIIPILLGYFLVSGMSSNSSYSCVFSCATSTTAATSTGAGTVTAISIPSGAGNPSGAPGYAPDSVTVVIGVNSTVTWTNDDTAGAGVPHTVTALNTTAGAPVFDSGNLPAGQSFTYNFTLPGTYQYHCNYHSWMVGTVVVKAGGASVAAVKVTIPGGSGTPNGAPGFSPDTITLVMGVNNTVTWTNADTAPHTVTANNLTAGAAIFDSGNLAAGASYTYTFTAPGTYPYHCNYHSWMVGTVVVKAGGASAAPAAPIAVSMPSGAGTPSGAPGFSPDKMTLVIGLNNTVIWTNNDSAHHTVTSTSVPSGASSFNSGDMAPGATYTYTFSTPGTYQYDCTYHSWMVATVTVVQG